MKSESSARRVSDLSQNAPTPFKLAPDSVALKEIAQEFGVDGLKKLRFEGEIRAKGTKDWELVGQLGFTVVQPCVVTLEAVTTRVDTRIERSFLAAYELPDGEEEAEMHEDDNIEPLGDVIDPEAVMLESVALNLPQYPRKDGAELGETILTEPGAKPMTDEDTKPFAGLADLFKGAANDTDR